MSTYVYMRILESAPYRYDFGIRLLSFGRIDRLYRETAELVVAGTHSPRVLEIGCGTGNLTREIVSRGAIVCAVDQNPEMLSQARAKLSGDSPQVQFQEMAAVEIVDRFQPGSFDAVAASLVLSEMSDAEQLYVIRAAATLLHPGGKLVIADEVRSPKLWQRLLHACLRWPAALVTYALTQTSTSAVPDLPDKVQAAGMRIVSEQYMAQGSICILVAVRGGGQCPSQI